MATLKLVTPASELPITLQEIKEHLRVDTDYDDILISLYITAAIGDAENFLGRSLVDQTWEYTVCNADEEIVLPKPPIIEVLSVTADDEAVASEDFEVDRSAGTVTGEWDGKDVVVTYRAGYTDLGGDSPNYTQPIPPEIIAAVYLLVADLYAFRETTTASSVNQIPAAERMLRKHRLELGMA